MVKELVTDFKILSERSKEWDVVNNQNIMTELVNDMEDTIKACDNRNFLIAKYIGRNERVVCIKFSDDVVFFNNPLIQERKNLVMVPEHDFGTNKDYLLPRYSEVIVVFQNEAGVNTANKLQGPAAAVMCQAIDALEGIFPSDYGLEITEEYLNASKEEQAEVIEYYIKYINDLQNKLSDDLESDESVKEAWNAVKFMKSVAAGETKVEKIYEEKPQIKMNRAQRRAAGKLGRKLEKMLSKIKGENDESKS